MLKKRTPGWKADLVFPSSSNPIEVLRNKWNVVPGGNNLRIESNQFVNSNISELIGIYESALSHDTLDEGFGIRGWFHEIYKGKLKGKTVLDIGSGLGISSIYFARHGAKLHFTDIVETNLHAISRICDHFGLDYEITLINKFDDFASINRKFDFVMALGSLLNTPFSITKTEFAQISKLMAPGSRYLHLSYPKTRWLREGSLDFDKWGEITDGPGTPWMEYHDLEKMDDLLQNFNHRLLFGCEFHNSDFNWFDFEIL